jgi:hypothetical protein
MRWKRRKQLDDRGSVVRRLAGLGFFLLMLLISVSGYSQTLQGTTVELHEGELVPASAEALRNSSGSLRLDRSVVGGLAPGRSVGASGLQLDGSVLAVPEPSLGLQGGAAIVALLGLLFLRRDRVFRAAGSGSVGGCVRGSSPLEETPRGIFG